jgi:hypothetical protein
MIYFIQEGNDGPIKIGKAGAVERRLKTLQTAHHKELSILQVIPGGAERESKIKNDLTKFKIKGEWFHPVAEVFEYMRSVKFAEYEMQDGKPFAVLYRECERSTATHFFF